MGVMDRPMRNVVSNAGALWCTPLFACLSLSCSTPAPPPVPTSTRPTTAHVAASTAPSAEAPRLPSFPALPPTTTGLDAQLAYLGRVCGQVVRYPHKDEVYAGCACCPPFDSCKPKAPSAIGESMDPSSVLEEVFRGSFRRPGADEIAMMIYGCGSAATNEGGMLLATVTKGAFQDVEYREGLHPDTCTAMPQQEGIDRLLCRFTHGRAHHSTHVFVIDFTSKTQVFADMEFIELITQLPTVCLNGPGMTIRHDHLDSMRVVDQNGDGLADVEIVVTQQRGRVTKAMLVGCDDEIQPRDRSHFLLKPKTHTLRWLGEKGRSFRPDAATAALLPQL